MHAQWWQRCRVNVPPAFYTGFGADVNARACWLNESTTSTRDRLEAIHHSVAGLARAANARDVLARLTDAASDVIPHDEART
jgi:hypothetical protein